MNRLRGWWRFSGLAAAGTSARSFFDDNGKSVLFYRHERSNTAVVVAGDPEAQEELAAWFANRVERKGA